MSCGGCGGQPQNVPMPEVPQKTPILKPDGSIEFPEGAEVFEVEGYEVDPHDERRLIPTGPGCAWRITGVMLQKNGTFAPYHVCRHGQCEHRSKPVTFDICEKCPFRE